MPRRTFLRGAGSLIALPLLDAMIPGSSAAAKPLDAQPRRVGFIYVPNGMVMTDSIDLWTPKERGGRLDLSETLRPLQSSQDRLTIVTNLKGAVGAGQHAGAAASWLTGVSPERGSAPRSMASIDQHIASAIGNSTRLRSLEVGVENTSTLFGFQHCGFDCRYLDTLAWSASGEPMPLQVNPRDIFEQMFGSANAGVGSVLDGVIDDRNRLIRGLGAGDRATTHDYLDGVRDLERRVNAEQPLTSELGRDRDSSSTTRIRTVFDLLFLAYRADLTRVFTFMMGRELSNASYPEIGVSEPHHGLSHHQNRRENMVKLAKINRHHVQLFAKFVERLATTREGDGTLLDHTLLMYGSGISNGDDHDKSRLPIALVGGLLRGNTHIVLAPGKHALRDLHVDLAARFGVELSTVTGSESGTAIGLRAA